MTRVNVGLLRAAKKMWLSNRVFCEVCGRIDPDCGFNPPGLGDKFTFSGVICKDCQREIEEYGDIDLSGPGVLGFDVEYICTCGEWCGICGGEDGEFEAECECGRKVKVHIFTQWGN